MSDLSYEFERLRPQLLREGKRSSSDGAYARAMLSVMPHVIAHFEREQKFKVSPEHLVDGMANMLANVVLAMLRAAIAEDARTKALDVITKHIVESVRPQIARSAGGIILPNGAGHA